jgi:hypothetical protein
MTRYLIVLSIIYLSFSTNLYSQRCNLSVSGKITDLHDESPIIGAPFLLRVPIIFHKQTKMENI